MFQGASGPPSKAVTILGGGFFNMERRLVPQGSQCHCRKMHEVRTLFRKNVCHFKIDDTRPGVLWGECLLQLEFGAKGTHFVHFCATWVAARWNMAVSSHAARAGDGFSTACDHRRVNTYALTCSDICI